MARRKSVTQYFSIKKNWKKKHFLKSKQELKKGKREEIVYEKAKSIHHFPLKVRNLIIL